MAAPHRPRRRTWSLWALGVLVLLAACEATVGSDPDGLAGRTFVSSRAAGHDLVPGSEVRIIFQSDRIVVRAGCNTLSGAATWREGTLVVEQPMAHTMMACVDDLERQDDWLESFLLSSPSLRLDDGVLVLGDDDEGLALAEQ